MVSLGKELLLFLNSLNDVVIMKKIKLLPHLSYYFAPVARIYEYSNRYPRYNAQSHEERGKYETSL